MLSRAREEPILARVTETLERREARPEQFVVAFPSVLVCVDGLVVESHLVASVVSVLPNVKVIA